MIDNNNPQTVLHCRCPPNPTKRKTIVGANTHLVARLSLFIKITILLSNFNIYTHLLLAQLSGCLGT